MHGQITLRNAIFVFGGSGNNNMRINDIFRFDTVNRNWCEIKAKNPEVFGDGRYDFGYFTDNRRKIFVFGGTSKYKSVRNLLNFDLDDLEWNH